MGDFIWEIPEYLYVVSMLLLSGYLARNLFLALPDKKHKVIGSLLVIMLTYILFYGAYFFVLFPYFDPYSDYLPLGFIFCFYLIFLFISIINRKQHNRIQVWRRVFFGSMILSLFLTAIYFIVYLINYDYDLLRQEAHRNLYRIAIKEANYYEKSSVKVYTEDYKKLEQFPKRKTARRDFNKYSYYLSQREPLGPSIERENIPVLSFQLFDSYEVLLLDGWKIDENIESRTLRECVEIYGLGPTKNTAILESPESVIATPEVLVWVLDDVGNPVQRQLVRLYGIEVSSDNFTVMAVGNIDADAELDVWMVDKTGKAINLQDDITTGNFKHNYLHKAFYYHYKHIVLYINDWSFSLSEAELTFYLFLFSLVMWILFRWLDKRRTGDPV